MPQNPTNITDSTEFKEFCKKANLEVLNNESINVYLYNTWLLLLHLQEENEQTILSQEEIINDYKKRINKLEEMIMEIAKNIKSPDIKKINENWNLEVTYWWTLFDKWNN